MVTVTESAKEELKNTLSEADISEPNMGLRLAQTAPEEFGLMLDEEQEGDQVVEHEGSKVLLVGADLMELLEGFTIDCQNTPEGQRLTISKD